MYIYTGKSIILNAVVLVFPFAALMRGFAAIIFAEV